VGDMFDSRIRKHSFVECIDPNSRNFRTRGSVVHIDKPGAVDSFITYESWDVRTAKLTQRREWVRNLRKVNLEKLW